MQINTPPKLGLTRVVSELESERTFVIADWKNLSGHESGLLRVPFRQIVLGKVCFELDVVGFVGVVAIGQVKGRETVESIWTEKREELEESMVETVVSVELLLLV